MAFASPHTCKGQKMFVGVIASHIFTRCEHDQLGAQTVSSLPGLPYCNSKKVVIYDLVNQLGERSGHVSLVGKHTSKSIPGDNYGISKRETQSSLQCLMNCHTRFLSAWLFWNIYDLVINPKGKICFRSLPCCALAMCPIVKTGKVLFFKGWNTYELTWNLQFVPQTGRIFCLVPKQVTNWPQWV